MPWVWVDTTNISAVRAKKNFTVLFSSCIVRSFECFVSQVCFAEQRSKRLVVRVENVVTKATKDDGSAFSSYRQPSIPISRSEHSPNGQKLFRFACWTPQINTGRLSFLLFLPPARMQNKHQSSCGQRQSMV